MWILQIKKYGAGGFLSQEPDRAKDLPHGSGSGVNCLIVYVRSHAGNLF